MRIRVLAHLLSGCNPRKSPLFLLIETKMTPREVPPAPGLAPYFTSRQVELNDDNSNLLSIYVFASKQLY